MADVINMFRSVEVCDRIKSPLAPHLKKGGNGYIQVLLVVTIDF